jgi:hypothetical protein
MPTPSPKRRRGALSLRLLPVLLLALLVLVHVGPADAQDANLMSQLAVGQAVAVMRESSGTTSSQEVCPITPSSYSPSSSIQGMCSLCMVGVNPAAVGVAIHTAPPPSARQASPLSDFHYVQSSTPSK